MIVQEDSIEEEVETTCSSEADKDDISKYDRPVL